MHSRKTFRPSSKFTIYLSQSFILRDRLSWCIAEARFWVGPYCNSESNSQRTTNYLIFCNSNSKSRWTSQTISKGSNLHRSGWLESSSNGIDSWARICYYRGQSKVSTPFHLFTKTKIEKDNGFFLFLQQC